MLAHVCQGALTLLNVKLMYFWRIRICFAEHEYKHDSKKHLTRGSPRRCAADRHLLPSQVHLCLPAMEALTGAWCPISGVLARFTSHLESPEPREGDSGFSCPSGAPTLFWSRSAVREPLSHQHLRNKSDTLLTAAYGEAGGWGITWKECYSQQVFSSWWKKMEEGQFVFKGKAVCSLNSLGLIEKFPQV